MKTILILLSFIFILTAEAALTTHELFHLNSIKQEALDNNSKSVNEKKQLADDIGMKHSDYTAYLDAVVTEVNDIIIDDVMPVGVDDPSDLHDSIEDSKK